MAIDPEVDPQAEPSKLPAPGWLALGTVAENAGPFAAPARPFLPRVPNIGHAAVFLAVAGGALLLVQSIAFALALGLHWFPHKTYLDLAKEPRLLVPASFFSYLLGGLAAIAIFSTWWKRPFAEGVHWNLAAAQRRSWRLVAIGAVVSVIVQLLSNFLPIPKQLPIDDFFRSPVDVWIVAGFGIFIAPLFEELAFRGFLLPALATSWDWMTARLSKRIEAERSVAEHEPVSSFGPLTAFEPLADSAWSSAAIVFASTLTSIAFALLHADQLAHAYAPLGVLFGVSLVLCAVRLRYHSLAASALVHACYNGTIFALLFFATSGFRHLEKLNQ